MMNSSSSFESDVGKSKRIVLMSVGSYRNRGCEAIVRGTMEILRRTFGADLSVTTGIVANRSIAKSQSDAETDPAISSFALTPPGGPRGSIAWLMDRANHRLGTSFHPHLNDLRRHLTGSSIALEVGGDHYSLDYGRPIFYMAIDRYLKKRGVPVFLWGASVGPFDADQRFSEEMFSHLRSLDAVFVRETESLTYLRTNNVIGNVHLMADPAFAMTPEKPPPSKFNQDIPADAIGINLSPLIAYFREGNTKQSGLEDWTSSCAKLVLAAAELGRPIVLTPHVGSAAAFTEDFGLLRAVHKLVKDKASVPITILSGDFNAAELKWLISKFAVFAGARTHSTIAAISSQVPTLSISYSIKAKGINRDVYDNLDFCVHVSDLTPDVFREKLRLLLSNETSIREHLSARIPQLIDRAFAAGETLRNLLQSPALQGLESDSEIQALSSHC